MPSYQNIAQNMIQHMRTLGQSALGQSGKGNKINSVQFRPQSGTALKGITTLLKAGASSRRQTYGFTLLRPLQLYANSTIRACTASGRPARQGEREADLLLFTPPYPPPLLLLLLSAKQRSGLIKHCCIAPQDQKLANTPRQAPVGWLARPAPCLEAARVAAEACAPALQLCK